MEPCLICHDDEGELHRFCLCTTPQHEACVIRWIREGPHRSCSACNHPYNMELPKSFLILSGMRFVAMKVTNISEVFIECVRFFVLSSAQGYAINNMVNLPTGNSLFRLASIGFFHETGRMGLMTFSLLGKGLLPLLAFDAVYNLAHNFAYKYFIPELNLSTKPEHESYLQLDWTEFFNINAPQFFSIRLTTPLIGILWQMVSISTLAYFGPSSIKNIIMAKILGDIGAFTFYKLYYTSKKKELKLYPKRAD